MERLYPFIASELAMQVRNADRGKEENRRVTPRSIFYPVPDPDRSVPLSEIHLGVEPEVIQKDFEFMDSQYGPPRGSPGRKSEMKNYFVSYIISPDEFYIQNPKQQEDLKALEASMTEWYNMYWDSDPASVLTKDTVKLGGFYAVFDYKTGTCQRARIDGMVLNYDFPEYYGQLIDHGTHGVFQLDEIYSLRAEYLKLPMQASAARLYDATKPRQIWTHEVKKQFEKDMLQKNVDAFIMKSSEDPNQVFGSLEIVLVPEVNGNREVYTIGGVLNIPL